MTPLEYLQEEFKNVERTLNETLRYDYGPTQGTAYYQECSARLAEIGKAIPKISSADFRIIQAQLIELSQLSSWILLIERSHLGEFSWPFADALQRTAVTLLSSSGLSGDPIEPLMHVVAEAETYQIVPEPQQVPAASSRRPFIVVAFPRSLKHHALLHLIFGHELGHSAFQMQATMQTLYGSVVPALQTASPMANPTAANAWLLDSAAPADVKASLAKYHSEVGESFEITDDNISDWLEELTCDLFGLILFGPPFVARIGLIWNRFVLIPIRFI